VFLKKKQSFEVRRRSFEGVFRAFCAKKIIFGKFLLAKEGELVV